MPVSITCGNLCSTLHAGGVDEEGLDQGGVKKEFFQLLTREIFNEVSDGTSPHVVPLLVSWQARMLSDLPVRSWRQTYLTSRGFRNSASYESIEKAAQKRQASAAADSRHCGSATCRCSRRPAIEA